MPFDDASLRSEIASQVKVPNTLAAIGLQPVPRAIAEAHKAHMIQKISALSEHYSECIRVGIFGWRTCPVRNRYVLEQRPMYSSERFAAPPEVVALYRDVKKKLREAEFTMDYFYTDPILNVTYTDGHGLRHHDCLAVWDNGTVIAMATGKMKWTWRDLWPW